jgi:hypothetical protein
MDELLKKQVMPIYSEVGAVVQNSQHMEFSIAFSITMLKQLDSSAFSDDEFHGHMDLFSKKTLGRLIGDLKKFVELDDASIEALKLSLNERNYIIHHFFYEDIERLVTIEGRKAMLERVQQARKNMDPGYSILDTIVDTLMSASGMSIEQIMEEVESSIEI